MLRHASIPLTLLLASALASAQAPTCTQSTFATVVSRKDGSTVHGLEAKDFRARVGRRPATISSARLETEGLGRVVLVVDASGSMSDRWGLVEQMVARFLHSAPEATPIGMVINVRNELRRFPLTGSRTQVDLALRAVGAEKLEGRTALYDALNLALSVLEMPQPGDVIYLVSDGGENASRLGQGALRDALAASQVRLFAALTTDPLPRTAEERNGPFAFETMARQSGGYAIARTYPDKLTGRSKVRAGEELVADLDAMYARMKTYYLLEVAAPAGPTRALNWNLEVVDERNRRRRDVEVAYPRRLPPCAPPAE